MCESSGFGVSEMLWVVLESNQAPLHYQCNALTRWANDPRELAARFLSFWTCFRISNKPRSRNKFGMTRAFGGAEGNRTPAWKFCPRICCFFWRRESDSNRRMVVLQTTVLTASPSRQKKLTNSGSRKSKLILTKLARFYWDTLLRYLFATAPWNLLSIAKIRLFWKQFQRITACLTGGGLRNHAE